MKTGTIVMHGERRGVVAMDIMACCGPDETPVVFDGGDFFEGTLTKELREVGTYEAKPDPAKCGAGQGAECCIYLTCGPKGFECERFSSLRNTLIFRTMNAKRQPTSLFPACMSFAGTGSATGSTTTAEPGQSPEPPQKDAAS